MSRAEETREPREHSQESDQAPVASVQPLGVPSEGPVGLADAPAQKVLRARVREACAAFGNAYWRELDRQRAYPEEFVRAFTQNRLLAALIPDEYGGLGLPLSDAAIVTEEINRAGGNAGTAHAQMYIMGALCATAARPKNNGGCRRSRAEDCVCRHSASRNRRPAATRPRSARKRSGTAMSTWSTARSAGPRGCRTPISCSSSRAPRRRHPAKRREGSRCFSWICARRRRGACRTDPRDDE